MEKARQVFLWIAKVTAAIIMVQTLYYKFGGAPESIYIFSKIGMEPWGRYGTGGMELIASILILIPRTAWAGGLLGMGLMAGAIFFHLTSLGIMVNDDKGLLFVMSVVTFLCCSYVVLSHRGQIPILKDKIS